MNISGLRTAHLDLQSSAQSAASAATPDSEPSPVISQAAPIEAVRAHEEHPRSGERLDHSGPRGEDSENPGTDSTEAPGEQGDRRTIYTANTKALQRKPDVLGVIVDIRA